MTSIPSSAEAVLPSESPILGSPDDPAAVARYLGVAAAGTARYRTVLQQARFALGRVQSDGVAEIAGAIGQRLEVGALALTQTADTARIAFACYAAEVERIHAAARWVRGRVEAALSEIRGEESTINRMCQVLGVWITFEWSDGPPDDLPTPSQEWALLGGHPVGDFELGGSDARALSLRAQYEPLWAASVLRWRNALAQIDAELCEWRRLLGERSDAELALLVALNGTALGQLITVSASTVAARRESIAFGFAGELWGSTRSAVSRATEHTLLTKLIGTRSGAEIWQTPPPPWRVAESWHGLTAAEQQRLISEVPWVIGNLSGLPFAVRDQANRRLLEYYALHHDGLSPECVQLLRELTTVLQNDSGGAPVTLVSLNLNGSIPMVAVGYGPLDTAASLTWEVPGMSSDAHLALSTWHTASNNLYAVQERLLKTERADTDSFDGEAPTPAVVAFLAYDTPNLATVLFAESAREGAHRLAAELDGAAATRGQGMPLATHAVVAHSYGTPVAANALTLTRYPVQSLTMVGSAGLDEGRVRVFEDLHIDRNSAGEPRVFTTQAARDLLAPLGAALSDRAQPNPAAVVPGQNHLAGAYAFGSDGYGTLRAADGHSIIGEGTRGLLGSNASADHGYFDQNTQSLVGTAAASLGLLRRVPGGLTRDGEPVHLADAL